MAGTKKCANFGGKWVTPPLGSREGILNMSAVGEVGLLMWYHVLTRYLQRSRGVGKVSEEARSKYS